MTGRVPRCCYCGGNIGQLNKHPIRNSTEHILVHSSCEKPAGIKPAGPVFAHPLLQHRRGGAIVGFIRSNNPPTDAQGWFSILPESTST